MGSVTEWMASKRPTIIYGAGKQAAIVYRFSRIFGKEIVAIMTSGDTKRNATLPNDSNLPLVTPDTYQGSKSDVDIILSFGGGHVAVYNDLRGKGYCHIYYTDNWTEGNALIQQGKIADQSFCIQLAEPQMVFDGDIRSGIIHMCCNMPNRPKVEVSNTPEETFNAFFGLRARCVSEYVLHESHPSTLLGFSCASCENLCKKEYLWHYTPFVTYINLTLHPSPCQCKCIYCSNEIYKWIDTDEVKNAYEKLFETLEYGKNTGLIWKHAVWQLSSGEITIHPYRERFLELVDDCNAAFFTNAFIFDKDIAGNLHRNPNSLIKVSVDSGTRDTWEKIKGIDNFDKVTSNLEKYAVHCYDKKFQLLLKYIVLPGVNDNEKDYLGYINLLKNLGMETFEIARDLRYKFDGDVKKKNILLDSTARLIYHCKLNDISTTMDLFSPEEEKEIYEKVNSL